MEATVRGMVLISDIVLETIVLRPTEGFEQKQLCTVGLSERDWRKLLPPAVQLKTTVLIVSLHVCMWKPNV